MMLDVEYWGGKLLQISEVLMFIFFVNNETNYTWMKPSVTRWIPTGIQFFLLIQAMIHDFTADIVDFARKCGSKEAASNTVVESIWKNMGSKTRTQNILVFYGSNVGNRKNEWWVAL